MAFSIVRPAAMALAATLIACSASADPFTNGDFESPVIPGAGPRYRLLKDTLVPGWLTTDQQGNVEIWADGYSNVFAYRGRQFVELNSTSEAGLYQNVTGIARGSVVYLGFAHRGRSGVDLMELIASEPGADGLARTADDKYLLRRTYQTDTSGWRTHTAWFTATGNPFLLGFNSLQTAGNATYGNLLDAVTMYELPVATLMRGTDAYQGRSQTVLENAASYDCRRFDQSGFCIGGGVQLASVDSRTSGAGWMVFGWRPAEKLRIGGFLQAVDVLPNPDGFQQSSRLPLLGLFAGFGDDVSGLGWQAKAYAATLRDQLSIIVAGATGPQSAPMRGVSAGASLGFGFGLNNGWALTPSASFQRVETKRKSYGESKTDVEGLNPLSYTYADYGLARSVARIGASLAGALAPGINGKIAGGVSSNVAARADDFTITIDNGDRIATPTSAPRRAVRPYVDASIGYTPRADVEMRLSYSAFAASVGAARYAQVGAFGIVKGF